jgi:hypothetical protein
MRGLPIARRRHPGAARELSREVRLVGIGSTAAAVPHAEATAAQPSSTDPKSGS